MNARLRLHLAVTAGVLALSLFGEGVGRAAPPPPVEGAVAAPLDLLTARSLALEPGESFVVRGLVRTSHDGVTYDAVARYDDASGAKLGGLLATDGVGLHVTRRERGFAELVASGEDAPLCRAAGVLPPCLVPRTASLAHDRLLSVGELLPTLSGALTVELPKPVTPPLVPTRLLAWPLAVLLGLAATLAAAVFAHRVRTRPIARVRRAAVEARRSVRGTTSAARIERQIDTLSAHAESLVRAESTLSARIAREEKRTPGTASAFGVREASELERLRGERDRARARVTEIETALRVLAMKMVRAGGSLTETEATLGELDRDLAIVDEAEREAEAALTG
ncbi:MAG: hypothetical protein U0235_12015 [Polyangiaceae bacterium]